MLQIPDFEIFRPLKTTLFLWHVGNKKITPKHAFLWQPNIPGPSTHVQGHISCSKLFHIMHGLIPTK